MRCIQYKEKLTSFMPQTAWRGVGKMHACRVVVLKVWFLDQKHNYHVGTCQKHRFLTPTPELLNLKFWPWDAANMYLKQLSKQF